MPTPFYVGGEWRRGNTTLTVTSPYDGHQVGTVALAGVEDAQDAIVRAHRARLEVRQTTRHDRATLLREVAHRLASDKDDWAELITNESGKPYKASLHEVDRAVATFNTAAEEVKRLHGELVPLDTSAAKHAGLGISQRIPVGIVTAITPFNSPLNLVAHKLAPALASGNCVILKPAPQAPLSALRLANLFHNIGVIPGALSVIPCSNEDAELLLTDSRIGAVSFTGSQIGWEIKRLASDKKVTLELGGNGGIIIHADADIGRAAERAVAGAFNSSGQRCISTRKLLVHKNLKDEFTRLFLTNMQRLKVGDPSDPETDVGPLIDEAAAVRAEEAIKEALEAGATLLSGGGRHGATIEPTVLTGVPEDVRLWCDEVFAPITVIREYGNFSDAVSLMNDSQFGLQVGVFTNSLALVQEAFDQLEYGGVIINNDPGFREENMPYGGTKASGFGREGIRYAIEGMTEEKLLVISSLPGNHSA